MPTMLRQSARIGLASASGQAAPPTEYDDEEKPKEHKAKHLIFVDAGSTGSKVFAFTPNRTTIKFLTECSDYFRTTRTKSGIAALGTNQADCEWHVGVDADREHWAELTNPSLYAPWLLDVAVNMYKNATGLRDTSNVVEKDSIPIFATGGMRLLSKETNDKVWALVCNRSSSGLTFAPHGPRCGTIAGTTEAYYEFLANAMYGKSPKMTGTFTIGGASAQIAIPLRTEEDVQKFVELKAKIYKDLDCEKLLLADGTRAPFFATKREGLLSKNCIDDYITYKNVSHIKAPKDVERNNIQVHKIKAVGLISFLGLEGQGTFVAGGVEQIQRWAGKVGCTVTYEDAVQASYQFGVCRQRLIDSLNVDIMWRNVKHYFHNNAFDLSDFSYNTFAATPKYAGVSGDISGQDQAWELQNELNYFCGPDINIGFGQHGSNSCLKALFTTLYITEFFKGPHQDFAPAPTYEPPKPQHSYTELHFDPNRAWVEGLRGELQASQAHPQARRLLATPVRRLSTHFVDGARIHFSQ